MSANKFLYSCETRHDFSEIFTQSYPTSTDSTYGFRVPQDYTIHPVSYYNVDQVDQAIDTGAFFGSLSHYSIVFFESTSNMLSSVRYIRTNTNYVSDMLVKYPSWEAQVYNKVSVPPKSELHLYEGKSFIGKSIIYENVTNTNLIFDTYNISSFKWITYTPRENFVDDQVATQSSDAPSICMSLNTHTALDKSSPRSITYYNYYRHLV